MAEHFGARHKPMDSSEWKNVPVRRVAIFIEESIDRDTQWVVFEPNDEPLWAKIRRQVEDFLQDLFVQGACCNS
jgi:phage tail sheath protein FI